MLVQVNPIQMPDPVGHGSRENLDGGQFQSTFLHPASVPNPTKHMQSNIDTIVSFDSHFNSDPQIRFN